MKEFTAEVKKVARANGADLVGVVRAIDLPEHAESMETILPGAKSVVVVAASHARTAISSANTQVAQFDTAHTYAQSSRAALAAARFLEARGHPAAAVSGFVPLDMAPPKKGMRGEICWRRAGVRSGLGSYGENGLLVTPEFGAAVRLAGVVTRAELEPGQTLDEDVCDHCGRCVSACPAEALAGEGQINKKLCGNRIFLFGFRYFQDFIRGLMDRPTEEVREIVEGHGLRELWQSFMTGNYYYCWSCQNRCPATRMPDRVTD